MLFSAGGLDISFAKNNPNIGAILWVGYPGERGAPAIADPIFGKYNPEGRLPLTWHEASYVDMLPVTSMPLRPVDSLGYPGRTYKFFSMVLQFSIWLRTQLHQIQLHIKVCSKIKTNKAKQVSTLLRHQIWFQRWGRGCDCLLQAPTKDSCNSHQASNWLPESFVPAGGSKKVRFVLNLCGSLHAVDYNAYSVLPSGDHTITIGDNIVSFPLHVNFSS
ncbi:hypothetical protein Tsubulata_001612 [Turnera subulata]|uniref:Glycoside hydrolase family 3 C-terminal domain-containing protein n=1 Tax=Turnera subulata TaxID=218843 RepID=A0A9Q0IZ55_9ROSI|nr:hypothetical protein Tsubulata_001612 [Turnera subulata]